MAARLVADILWMLMHALKGSILRDIAGLVRHSQVAVAFVKRSKIDSYL